MTGKQSGGSFDTPDWAYKANARPTEPDFIDGIPDRLKSLGRVFFPIPPLRKGWNYPHHQTDHRHRWDSKELNAYLEAGWGYGVACADDLVVIDIDNKSYTEEILDGMPRSMYQHTGSGDGLHVFYRCEDYDRGASLKTKEDVHGESNVEVGDIKGHHQSYVVGPGSTHPSGNEYGPLVGDEIATIDVSLLEGLEERFEGDSNDGNNTTTYTFNADPSDTHRFYQLDADEVAPQYSPEQRTSNPFHGSSTGTNFMMTKDGSMFMCWRCSHGTGEGASLSGVHYLAASAIEDEMSNYHCEYVRNNWHSDNTLHWKAWCEAVRRRLVDPSSVPYGVVVGFAEHCLDVSEEDISTHGQYHYLREQAVYTSLALSRQSN